MRGYALIATHHKSGTSWMSATFREIGERTGIPFLDASSISAITAEDCPAPAIILASHSVLRPLRGLFEGGAHRILHLIRDPRDMIISGAHYHQKSAETWLHNPDDRFGGQGYQQYLNSLPDDHARYMAELKVSGAIIRMANWNYGRRDAFECKYEELITDTEMNLFTKVVGFLGFQPDDLEICKRSFWNNSIFGGKAAKIGKTTHLRSGASSQWKNIFDRKLANAFISQFGDILIKLGYEEDNQWVEQLPENRAVVEA